MRYEQKVVYFCKILMKSFVLGIKLIIYFIIILYFIMHINIKIFNSNIGNIQI